MDGSSATLMMAAEVAATILAAFEDYNRAFSSITRRARRRFEERDWKLGQRDAVERIELYDRRLEKCLAGLVASMGRLVADEDAWQAVRARYAGLIRDCPDREFYETFFNSLTRKIFRTVGVNPAVEFLGRDPGSEPDAALPPLRTVVAEAGLVPALGRVIADVPWATLLADPAGAAGFAAGQIERILAARALPTNVERLEILEPVFYRGTRAFLVGRMAGDGWALPLVIAFRHGDDGICADAVMVSDYEIRPLFGFSRSYFHADLPAVGAAVRFLRLLMPGKAVDELYTVLGRAKQGKTERYRNLFRHLDNSSDPFVHAEGQRGMVMIVFTLASSDLVFKVIRDRFAYPKNTSRAEVIDKYRFVFRHDRVGRLVDAQEFRRLRFPHARFAPEVLAELLGHAGETCRLDGDDLIVGHCYVERRLKPLDVYLQDAAPAAAHRAVRDYGQAIRDLARSNVFPGDLLLKNFGVSRHGRVVFYDYDELCLVTECRFRELPAARDDADEWRAEPWYYVGPTDVFPEQFLDFLGLRGSLREEFLTHHAELLTADYWRQLQASHEAERYLEVVPYTRRSAPAAPATA